MTDPYATVDLSRAPIVDVKVVNEVNDLNFQAYLDGIGAAFRELDKFALIFDTGDLTRFPSRYREMQARWLKETEAEFRGRWICAAFVIKNPVIRGVLMALYWLNEPYYANKVVRTREEAWSWCCEQMAKAGVDVPGEV